MRPLHLQHSLVAYADKGKSNAVSVAAANQLAVFNARAGNHCGATINVGIMRKLSSATYKLFTKVATVYTNVGAAIIAGTSTQIVDTTASDGFIVQGAKKFGLIGLTVSNTATGGTYTFQYHNGSAWTTLTTLEAFTNFNATGDVYVVFVPPSDWAVGDAAATAIDQALYSIRILHTVAPGDAGNVSAMWLGEFLEYYAGVGDGNLVELNFDAANPFILDAGEALFPYFATANAANTFAAFYGTMG